MPGVPAPGGPLRRPLRLPPPGPGVASLRPPACGPVPWRRPSRAPRLGGRPRRGRPAPLVPPGVFAPGCCAALRSPFGGRPRAALGPSGPPAASLGSLRCAAARFGGRARCAPPPPASPGAPCARPAPAPRGPRRCGGGCALRACLAGAPPRGGAGGGLRAAALVRAAPAPRALVGRRSAACGPRPA